MHEHEKDIGLFIDYDVTPTDRGFRVTYLMDNTFRDFLDLTSAVDFAASRTLTLSPVYPAGYRSRTVRLLEQMGVILSSDLRAVEGERVDLITPDGQTSEEEVVEPTPEELLRRRAREYLRTALEADTSEEEASWVERARDLYAEAEFIGRRRAALTSSDDGEGDYQGLPDPWSRVSGRAISDRRRE